MKLCKIVVALATVCGALALQAQPDTTLRPIHPDQWPKIENHIRNSWDRYVDTVATLPAPFSFALNPGTLYYWDLYFINEGLMRQGFFEQAKNNIDNFIYEIEKLGFIPNANGWGEDRSQTPYFGMMVQSYFMKAPQKDTTWLHRAYQALLKEYEFWTNANGNTIEDHSTPIPGLQRYGEHADSATLLNFYDKVLLHRFQLDKEASDSVKILIASHRLAEAETMDFTPRFDGRCKDFIPIDLNANLYQYERILGWLERQLKISNGSRWEKHAVRRAELIRKYLWDEERGLFLDYDFVNQRHGSIASVMTLMPLYWHFATPEEAARVVESLKLFDSPGGLVVCEPSDQPILYQWGDGAVWAPVQFLAMGALENYGYQPEAYQVALKWLNTVTANFLDPHPVTHRPFKYGDGQRHPGFIYEKYTRTGEINDSEYPCSEMMGWTASTFLRALEVVRHTSAK